MGRFCSLPHTLLAHDQSQIRNYLQVTPFNPEARQLISETVSQSAQVMDNPADLINVAIEVLVKERYELPGFNTLDRLVCGIRNRVNQQIFSQVYRQLDEEYISHLDTLFKVIRRALPKG